MIIYERPNRFLNLGGDTLGRDCIVTVACKRVLHNTVKFRRFPCARDESCVALLELQRRDRGPKGPRTQIIGI